MVPFKAMLSRKWMWKRRIRMVTLPINCPFCLPHCFTSLREKRVNQERASMIARTMKLTEHAPDTKRICHGGAGGGRGKNNIAARLEVGGARPP